ncbi:hypothetical protein DKT77_14325 [Meridianimarinicoccus roseus]|uniref:ADP-ribose pyrophosphatase n=1 Tax=Meridianimarinicoccus roseus TaxID=2072018 RepID=A0A2V2L9N6_9RHOB|nr:NUDIX domain-containing protein [Meridianimarinicoccus roseus]PWR01942.1 hypothetical protein DKT77_14325 [Meridianimarinicoccus roseus]
MPFLLLHPFDDPAIFAAVTGLDPSALTPARLAGGVDEGTVGALAEVEGEPALGRLLFYAAVHGAAVDPGTAQMQDGAFVAARVVAPGPEPLAGLDVTAPLTERWLAIWREAASEILDAIGTQDSDQVQERLGMIWSRADSRLRGQASRRTPLGGLDRRNLRIRSRTRPYAGFFAVEDYVYSHDRFDGTDSGPLDRAAFIGGDAVTVLPYDPVRDTVLVVEQVRASAVARNDPSPWLIEPVAGRIDPGQSVEETARRETLEEAGLTLGALHSIGEYYPSTGAFTEYLYSFIGIADLPEDAAGLGGLASEAEDIRAHVMPRARLMELIAAGEAPVGTLLVSAFWLALNVDRLRQSG